MLLRMSTELVPVCLREFHIVVPRGLFNVGRCRRSFVIRDISDLIKSCDGVPRMLCVGPWLFTLLWKGKGGIGKVTSHCEVTVFFVGFPACFHFLYS